MEIKVKNNFWYNLTQRFSIYSKYETYMKLVAIFGNAIFYIQAFKIFAEKNADSISISAFVIGIIGGCSWLLYGILLKNNPLIISTAIALIGESLVLVGTLIYQN